MRMHEILLEFNIQKTVDNWAVALCDVAKKEDLAALKNLVGMESVVGILANNNDSEKYKRDAGAEIIKFFLDSDPTGGKFVLPMINWYVKRSMQRIEDSHALRKPITLYVKYKNRIKGLNINSITYDEFLDYMETFEQSEVSLVDKELEQRLHDNEEFEVMVDNDEFKVIMVLTEEAAKYFGRGTRWCTATEENNMFETYSEQDPIFVIIFKNRNERQQWHFMSDQFMDVKDKPLSKKAVVDVLSHPSMEPIRQHRLSEIVYFAIEDSYFAVECLLDSLPSISREEIERYAEEAIENAGGHGIEEWMNNNPDKITP